MTQNRISHKGIIHSLDNAEGDQVQARVEIAPQTACSSCRAKGTCSASSGSRYIDTVLTGGGDVGDEVIVEMHPSTGWKAVFFAFGLPLVLLLAAFFLFSNFTPWGETGASLFAIGILGPYYSLLWLMNHRIKKEFQFFSHRIV